MQTVFDFETPSSNSRPCTRAWCSGPPGKGEQGGEYMKSLLLTAIVGLFAISAQASNDIALGEPSYGGTGCPQGSVGVTLSPDSKVLSMIFDEYVAEAGKSSGKTIQRKTCNLSVPIHVPQGMSVSILKVDYRGYVYAPKGTQATFNVEYFLKSFNGSTTGPKVTKVFSKYDNDYLISNQLALSAVVWSACGEDVNLRVNSSMTARTDAKKQDVLATVDSVDVAAGIIYQLQWRSCK